MFRDSILALIFTLVASTAAAQTVDIVEFRELNGPLTEAAEQRHLGLELGFEYATEVLGYTAWEINIKESAAGSLEHSNLRFQTPRAPIWISPMSCASSARLAEFAELHGRVLMFAGCPNRLDDPQYFDHVFYSSPNLKNAYSSLVEAFQLTADDLLFVAEDELSQQVASVISQFSSLKKLDAFEQLATLEGQQRLVIIDTMSYDWMSLPEVNTWPGSVVTLIPDLPVLLHLKDYRSLEGVTYYYAQLQHHEQNRWLNQQSLSRFQQLPSQPMLTGFNTALWLTKALENVEDIDSLGWHLQNVQLESANGVIDVQTQSLATPFFKVVTMNNVHYDWALPQLLE